MTFDLQQFIKAMDKLKRELVSWDDSKLAGIQVDVELCEADPGSGKLIECIRLSCCIEVPPSNYSASKIVTKTLEVFAAHENRMPRISSTETFEVKD